MDLFDHIYTCIYCGCTKLKPIERRYRSAFCGRNIHWVLYDRYMCLNQNCIGGCEKYQCFGSIDRRFLEQLQKFISYNFKYMSPSKGPEN